MTDWQGIIDACWPAARFVTEGPWTVRVTHGAGSRVAAISGNAPDQIDQAEALARSHDQTPLFVIWPGQEAVDAALTARGYDMRDNVTIWTHPIAPLTQTPMPHASGFTIWPPLQIMRDIWSAGSITPARQAVMERAADPMGVLARVDDRAAGAAFVAAHGDTVMMSAVEVLPQHRRKGVAGTLLRAAAHWAKSRGCTRIALIAADANEAANATYASHGMISEAGYHYRRHPDVT